MAEKYPKFYFFPISALFLDIYSNSKVYFSWLKNDCIQTYTGSILIAVNPYKEIDIYTLVSVKVITWIYKNQYEFYVHWITNLDNL